ncbi:MAG: hypothetical protein GY820_32330, partial [Gammaproteobacteria bacterium]|nr:hypothetical protein [Gammaproteobacteria bacterium]
PPTHPAPPPPPNYIYVKAMLATNDTVVLNTSVKANITSSSEFRMYVYLYVQRKNERSLESLHIYYIAGRGITPLILWNRLC